MLDRSRRVPLAWAALCVVLFALLTVAVQADWGPVAALDDRGEAAQGWAADREGLVRALLVVEDIFGSVGKTVITLAIAAALLWKKHRRAAMFSVGALVVTTVVNTGLKEIIGRARPDWQSSQSLLETHAYPSGHSSSIAALAGTIIVLVVMLVRRSSVRQLTYVLAVVLALVVAADRVLLGRHFPSDTIAGLLVGTTVILVGLAVYSPLPRSLAEKAEPLPEVLPSERRLAVVLNPVKVEDVGQFKAIVTAMAREAGWSHPTWHHTTVEDPGTGMAEAAAVAGADLVLVCGGDGTVREVCAELAGTGIPVGIVPAGTGNLLARNLGIPLYIRAAIDVALNGQDRAIDMVEVAGDGMEDTHFMVMAGMGFDAAIMEGVNEDIKKKIGWFAYVISALKSLMFPAVKVEISVDGGEFTRHRARTVVIGNVGFLQAGMPLLPDAAIDDGQVDVVILHPRNFFAWIPLAWRVLLKRKHTDELVNRMTGQSVVVRAATETPRQLDGDAIGPGKELRMTCVHGRLLVRVPR
ncbi:diacylglycerol kinase family protein [Nocardioides sp. GCM10027113]|uniref:diacylglycerol kinase family protein n=1 Tax=unclassified Nocardioides TaxID=2615069 RepID=UPI00361A876F